MTNRLETPRKRLAVASAMLLLPALVALAGAAQAQNTAPMPTDKNGQASESVVPRFVTFSGTIKDRMGKVPGGALNLTFSLYEEQDGGTPLWVETQKVELDEQGHYTVLLGSTSPEGLPLDLFTSGRARWLGVQPQLTGEGEQTRILLVGMPYALKAADADTLGGKPVSAFVTTESQNSATSDAAAGSGRSAEQGGKSANSGKASPMANVGGGGTTNFVPLWTSNVNLGNSKIYQLGSNIGVGTTTPGRALEVSAIDSNTGLKITGTTSNRSWLVAVGAAAGDGKLNIYDYGAAASRLTIDTKGNVGIGTTNPSFPLHLPLGKTLRLEAGTSATDTADYFSFGGNGAFGIDAPGVPNGRFVVQNAGNVGINNPNPTTTLDVINNVAGTSAVNVRATAINSVAVHGTAAVNGTGVLGTSNNGAVGVEGSTNGICGFELCAATGVLGLATGGGVGVNGQSDTNIGVLGQSTSSTGSSLGVFGSVVSPSAIGVEGTGPNTGMEGIATANIFFAAGVFGHATATTGLTRGVYGVSDSASGIGVHGIAVTGGQFETGSGNEIVGRGFGHTDFRVDANGKVFADGGFQTGGADFAESFAARRGQTRYEAGDLLAIDRNGKRQLSLAEHAYSKSVAGVYSTKPGLLATVHTMFDPQQAAEVPLAVVGVVPCKVSTENGSIRPGDLLVASSTPGYAMRGTNRRRMLGAVVGKALEPLDKDRGIIEVLVTLQ